MPRVSVVIPNYNHARFLRRRVGSVLAQTYRDLEVIFLDDASTDDSLDVFRALGPDPRVRAVLNRANSGSTFKQWNRGFAEATGEFVWLAESDDYADPHLLARLVAAMDRHPGCGIAYCQSYGVDADDQVLGSYAAWTQDLDPDRWAGDFVLGGTDACRRYMPIRNVIPNASAALLRLDAVRRVGGADESFRVCGDWKLYCDVLLRSDLAFVAEPLNYFRQHAANVRRRAVADGTDVREIYRVLAHLVDAVRVPEEVRRVAGRHIARYMVGNALAGRTGARAAIRLLGVARRHDPDLYRHLVRGLANLCDPTVPLSGGSTAHVWRALTGGGVRRAGNRLRRAAAPALGRGTNQ
jgi:glycosyltransferase involved in cell wall biosynthesis